VIKVRKHNLMKTSEESESTHLKQ